MDSSVQAVMDKRIEKVISNLEKRNMKGYHVRTRDKLFSLLSELVPAGSSVSNGGSMTLNSLGVLDWLRERGDITFYDRENDDPRKCMVAAFDCDVYFAGTNAITESGELYNVDGNGNRIAAMIYGPKSVVLVAGANKIVTDLNTAIDRVRKIAAPANTVRLSCATPCAKTGECMNCDSPARICCSYSVLSNQRVKGRIKVIIMDESLGF